MLSIVYSSNSTQPFTNEDLAALLEESRANNARRGVTGLLLFKDGQFMQTLEGADENVREAIDVITADPRHTDVKVLFEDQIERRNFDAWTMGFRLLTDDNLANIPDYDDHVDATEEREPVLQGPSRARWLMEWFRPRKTALED